MAQEKQHLLELFVDYKNQQVVHIQFMEKKIIAVILQLLEREWEQLLKHHQFMEK